VVAGGTGFLGSRICKAAVARSWEVVSISRSGQPNWSTITSSPTAPSWASDVKWEKADILKPATYAPFLKDANAVVHSMGILLEADYKGVLQGKESLFSGLSRAFSQRKGGSSTNPLDRGVDGELKPEEKDGQLTYELMNRDSAIALAQESKKAGVQDYVFISAAGGAPILPGRYITTKRQAESTIANQISELRSIFIRPGFLYDSSRLYTMALAYPVFPVSAFNWMIGKRLSPIAGAAVEKPLKADDVANAVVEAIDDASVSGPVQTEQIEELATRAWRKTML